MAKYRRQRINDSVAQEISLILRDVKDPRVASGMITVTGAEVSPDLKYAKIYYSLFSGDEQELRQGLKSSAGFIRGQLAHRLNLRVTPELTFISDASVKEGAHIAELLRTLDIPEDGGQDAEEENGDE